MAYNHAEYMRKWRLRRVASVLATTRRRLYGLSPEQYTSMHVQQGGLCAICRRPERQRAPRSTRARRLSVDHCHNTLRVRGLLCSTCNTAIGKMAHDPALLRRAAAYLEQER